MTITSGERVGDMLILDIDDEAPLYACRLPKRSFTTTAMAVAIAVSTVLIALWLAQVAEKNTFGLSLVVGIGILLSAIFLFCRGKGVITEFRPAGIEQLGKRGNERFLWPDIIRIEWNRSLTGAVTHRIVFRDGRKLQLPPDSARACRDVLELTGVMRPDVWEVFLFADSAGRNAPLFPLHLKPHIPLAPAMVLVAVVVMTLLVATVWSFEPGLGSLMAIAGYPFMGLCLVGFAVAARLMRHRFILDDDIIVVSGFGRSRMYPLTEYVGHRIRPHRQGGSDIQFVFSDGSYTWRPPRRESAMRVHFRLTAMYEASNTVESASIIKE